MPPSEMALHVPIPDDTVTVGPRNCDYADLQSAMIGASDGDIILIYEGANLVFTQNMILDKDLTIIAEPSLDLRQKQTTLLEITAPTVTGDLFFGDTAGKKIYFKGFKFTYDAPGGRVFLLWDINLVLDHCLVESTNMGTVIGLISDARLDFLESELNMKGNARGIEFAVTSSGLIRNSKIYVLTGTSQVGVDFASSGTLDVIDSEIESDYPINVTNGVVNLNRVFLKDSSGANFSVSQEGGAINFFGCSLYSQNINILQAGGIINWDQSSSCSGNDNSNLLIGGTFNRRTPQDSWETAALEDIATWSQMGQATNTITVGPTAGVYDYTDLQSAIAASVDGDWIICYQGGNYTITATQNITGKKIHIVAANFSYDGMGSSNAFRPSILIQAATVSRAFKLYSNGRIYFGGIEFYMIASPFMLLAGGAAAAFEHCRFRFENDAADIEFLADATESGGANTLDFAHCKIIHDASYLVRINDQTAYVNFVNCNIEGSGSPTAYLNHANAIVELDRVTAEIGYPGIEITSLGGQLIFRNSVTINAIECIKQAGGTVHAHDVTLNASALNSINQSAGTFNWGHVNIIQGPIVAGGTITPMNTPVEDYEYEVVGGVTRQVFKSVKDASDTKGNYPCKLLGAGTEYDSVGYMSDIAPWDYASIAAIELLVIPEANNVTFDYDVAVHYSADGEVYNAHAASTLTPNFNAVLDQKQAIDISSLFTSLAAGDSFGIEFTNQESTDQINILGVRFRWKRA